MSDPITQAIEALKECRAALEPLATVDNFCIHCGSHIKDIYSRDDAPQCTDCGYCMVTITPREGMVSASTNAASAIAALEFAQAEPKYSVEEVMNCVANERRYPEMTQDMFIEAIKRRLAAERKGVKR